MYKKTLILTILLLALTSCNNLNIEKKDEINKTSTSSTSEVENKKVEETVKTETKEIDNKVEEKKEINFQTAPLVKWDLVATMKTSEWDIQIKLFNNEVPFTVNNFVAHSQDWYYDNLIFHRVIKDFMIQGWDPTGTGMWGKSIYWEKFSDEFSDKLKNIKYSISMANSGVNTNWSQFFINQNNNSHLNNKHSVFWQVVKGEDVIEKIAKVETWAQNKPIKEVKIISIKIEKFGIKEEYKLDKKEAIKKYEDKIKSEMEAKKDLIIKSWDTVSVHYTLKLSDWTKKDSSLDRGVPLSFTVWKWMVIKAWDEWLVWHKIWDKFKLEVNPKDAYWESIVQVPKELVIAEMWTWVVLEKWKKLKVQWWEIEILDADEKTISVKNNHPLAGEKLFFDIEVVVIK